MIRIVCVGKLKEKATKQLVDEYVKRLTNYTKIEIIEVEDESNQLDESKVKHLEAERILKNIKKDSFVVLLDLDGQQISSPQLAKKLNDIYTHYNSNITFVIGGSIGVSEEVKKIASYRWQLSLLTFPHNLTRVILLEQIYRAYKILNNEIYHK